MASCWRRPLLRRPCDVWLNKVQEVANALLLYLRCGDLRSPGATERRNGSLGLRDDDDDDEGWLVSKMEGKLIFKAPTGSPEPGLLSVWKSLTYGVIWNSLTTEMHFSFSAQLKCRRKWNSIFCRKTETKVTFVYITELSYGSVANITFSAQRKWHFWNENEK